MAGGYGLGIGSFMTGLANGARMRSIFDKEQRDQEEHDINLRSKQFNLQNAEETAAHNRKVWSRDDEDRAKNAPLIDAKRKSELNTLSDEAELRDATRGAYDKTRREYDELRGRSILTAIDAQGKKHVSVDGQEVENEERAGKLFEQKHGSFSRYFLERGGAAGIRDAYLRHGDVAKADAFDKWIRQEGVQKAADDYGLGLQAATVKDWQGASDAFNRLATNGEYVSTDHHKVTFSPIRSADQEKADGMIRNMANRGGKERVKEKPSGIRVTYEDKDGNRSVKDYTDNASFFNDTRSLLHPYSIFEINKSTYDASVKAKAESDERANKLANDIVLKRYESDFKIAEERAKREGLDPKEIRQSMHDIMEDDANSGGKTLQKPALGKDGQPVRDEEGRIETEPLQGRERVQAAYDMAVDLYRGGRTTSPQPMTGGAQAQDAMGQAPQDATGGTVAPRRLLRSRTGHDAYAAAPAPQQQQTPRGRSIFQRRPVMQDYFAKLEGMQKSKAQADEAQARADREYVTSRGFPAYYTPEEVDAAIERRASGYMR